MCELNEIPGDHEEDVHTDIAARDTRVDVVEDHKQDSHGPQSINIAAIVQCRSLHL